MTFYGQLLLTLQPPPPPPPPSKPKNSQDVKNEKRKYIGYFKDINLKFMISMCAPRQLRHFHPASKVFLGV